MPDGDRIETGGSADLPEVMALAQGCSGLPQWTQDAWRTYVESGRGDLRRHDVLFVARASDGTMQGWLAAGGFEETVELALILVDPAQRRRGIGEQLMEHWLGWSRTRGAKEAVLEVRASNAAAIGLYSRLGFQVQGLRRGYYRDPGEDALTMRLTFADAGKGT